MDTTRTEELLTQLETADPAAAPDRADALTATLAEALDHSEPDDPDTAEPSDSDGGTP
jgi:hypothetical protein